MYLAKAWILLYYKENALSGVVPLQKKTKTILKR